MCLGDHHHDLLDQSGLPLHQNTTGMLISKVLLHKHYEYYLSFKVLQNIAPEIFIREILINTYIHNI